MKKRTLLRTLMCLLLAVVFSVCLKENRVYAADDEEANESVLQIGGSVEGVVRNNPYTPYGKSYRVKVDKEIKLKIELTTWSTEEDMAMKPWEGYYFYGENELKDITLVVDNKNWYSSDATKWTRDTSSEYTIELKKGTYSI